MGLVYMICRRLALLAIGYFLLTTVFFLSIRSFTLRIYSASQRQPISIHRFVVSNYTCVVARSHVKLRTNSQHCWPTMLGVDASVFAVVCKRMRKFPTLLGNNVGSCCVRVCSGVQTDATTPNNVGTCSAWWEGYNP